MLSWLWKSASCLNVVPRSPASSVPCVQPPGTISLVHSSHPAVQQGAGAAGARRARGSSRLHFCGGHSSSSLHSITRPAAQHPRWAALGHWRLELVGKLPVPEHLTGTHSKEASAAGSHSQGPPSSLAGRRSRPVFASRASRALGSLACPPRGSAALPARGKRNGHRIANGAPLLVVGPQPRGSHPRLASSRGRPASPPAAPPSVRSAPQQGTGAVRAGRARGRLSYTSPVAHPARTPAASPALQLTARVSQCNTL